MKHLVSLMKGRSPSNALGAIHIFANSSNLAACRDAVSEDAFWKILQSRYNPVSYRQPTAAPKAGQVMAMSKLLQTEFGLEEGDLTPWEREMISINDPMVTVQTLWKHTESLNQPDNTRASLSDLMSSSKKTRTPRTCFDAATPTSTDDLTSIVGSTRMYNPDSFEKLLSSLPEGTEVEYNVPYSITSINTGKPVTEPGREMLKIPAGWVIPSNGISSSSVGLSGGWHKIKLITHHLGRWRGGTVDNPEFTTTSRDNAVVSDGIVLVPYIPIDYSPSCSVMFAEFFTGKWHGLNHTRQKLHSSLRVRRPDGLVANDTFNGILLRIGKSSTYHYNDSHEFRLRHNGKVVNITVS